MEFVTVIGSNLLYYENKAAGTEGIVKQIHQYSKYYTEWNTASDKGTRIQRALYLSLIHI